MHIQEKIIPFDSLTHMLGAFRQQRIVCTNGVFDLMHIGHVRYLDLARQQGDLLVVGINSDRSTQRLKGPLRPLVPQDERAELIAGFQCVDFVTIFEQDTAEELLRAVRPAVYVKGGDYQLGSASAKPLPEASVIAELGGEVQLIPYVAGHSTSEMIARIMHMMQFQG